MDSYPSRPIEDAALSPRDPSRKENARTQAREADVVTGLERLKLEDGNGGPRTTKETIRPVHEKGGNVVAAAYSAQQSPAALPVVKGHVTHLGPAEDPYSEAVASRNASHEFEASASQTAQPSVPVKSSRRQLPAEDGQKEHFALGRSEDVETHTSQAPAVTHETRIVNTHEIITKPITREIHNHHIVHRVQPIEDVEVLPARHFVPSKSGNGLEEIAPPKASKGLEERIHDAFSVHLEESRSSNAHSAESGLLSQGRQQRQWISADGIACSESVLVHPPRLDTAAKEAGETVPLHVGRREPERVKKV